MDCYKLMPDPDLATLAAMIDRAAGTIARLRDERSELRQQVDTLENRLGSLEEHRRADRGKLDRLARLEEERSAVKSRLDKLLTALEPAGDDN